ncbi:UNVERIFIED_CONTAM: hypothetical protein K2H54_077755 [Gekko kuhli]
MKPEILQQVRVSLLGAEACNSSRWYSKRIHEYNLCALPDTGSREACQGAGGGPLMCWEGRSERFWVVGVNSWWSGCTSVRLPSVFISTQRFASWILKVTSQVSKPKPKPAAQQSPSWARPKPSTQRPPSWTPPTSRPISIARPTGWFRPGAKPVSRPSFSFGRPNYVAPAQPQLPTRRPAASVSSGNPWHTRPQLKPWSRPQYQQRPPSMPASQAGYHWHQGLPGSSAISRRPRPRPPYQWQNQGQSGGRL